MKISIEKAILHNGVMAAIRGVSQKNTTIPAMEGILLQAEGDSIRLTGCNGEMGVQCELYADVLDGGEIVVPGKLFSEVVRKLPDDYVQIDTKGVKMHIACGNSEYDILGMDVEDFPNVPNFESGESFEIKERSLRMAIGKTSFAVSLDESRPIHTGIQLRVEDGKMSAVAIDGFRIAYWREEVESGNDGIELVVPGSAMKDVERICADGEEVVCVAAGKQHIFFKNGKTQLFCRRLYGDFMDYKKAIPRESSTKVTVNRKKMMESVDRMALLSLAATDKQKSPLVMEICEENVSLSTKTSTGSASDVVGASVDGGGFSIGFNHKYLLDALKASPDDICMRMNGENSPCVIVPAQGEKNCMYMVLPVRLRA